MAQFKIYTPDPHPETSSVDGMVRRVPASAEDWATIRAGVGTFARSNQDSPTLYREGCEVDSSTTTNKFTYLHRCVYLFDAAVDPVPAAGSIATAILSLYGSVKDNTFPSASPAVNVYAVDPASNVELEAGDFVDFGVTPYCDTPIGYSAWSTTGRNNFGLNAAGLAAVSKDGLTKLGVRESVYDVGGVTFPWSGGKLWRQSAYCAEKGGTNPDYRPRLKVAYTVPDHPVSTLCEDMIDNHCFGFAYQKQLFYEQGRWWAFFSDRVSMKYSSSSDGLTWDEPVTLHTMGGYYINGASFSVAFDGVNFHYVYGPDQTGGSCYYRMGAPQVDGSISWAAAVQTVFTSAANYHAYIFSIAVDSNGYPWIAYFYGYISGSYTGKGMVTKSKTKDGTWVTEDVLFSAPYQFSASTYGLTSAQTGAWVVALTEGQVYCGVYVDSRSSSLEKNAKGRLWNGSAWEAEETIITSDDISGNLSPVADGDDIHMTYTIWNGNTPAGDDIYYKRRTYGVGWGAQVTVRERNTNALGYASLAIDDDGNLTCFWMDEPTANHLYCKWCISGVWDTDPTDLLAEEQELFFYYDWGWLCSEHPHDGKYLVGYTTKVAGMSYVKVALVTPTPPGPAEPPLVLGIDPVSGPTAGGTPVTITGENFVDGATAYMVYDQDGSPYLVEMDNVEFVSGTELTAVTPICPPGVKDVIVENPDEQSGTLGACFTYYELDPPLVGGIVPNKGPLAGGTAVEINGTGFVDGATVTIGGNSCTSVIFVSSTQLTAITPAGAAGAKDVVVTNPDTQYDTLANGFTYMALPTVTTQEVT